jgi:hypothetical protein
VNAEIVKVDPELAEIWLTTNQGNRNLRKTAVERYAKDMLAGQFTISNDAITFDADGRLINGQHRLSAVVVSGVTLEMLVLRDAPADSFARMDRGVSRTYADALRHRGEAGPVELGAVLNMAYSFDASTLRGGPWTVRNTSTITDVDRDAYLALHPTIRRSVEFVSKPMTMGTCTPSGAVVRLAHFLISREAGAEAADRYITQLSTQDREPAHGTIRTAVRALQQTRGRGDSQNRALHIIVTCYSHWARGLEIAKLPIHADYQSRPLRIYGAPTR